MFSRKITPELEIRLSIPQYADELFVVIDANREFLRQWLPWVDGTKSADDVRAFIQDQLYQFARGEAILFNIFHEGAVAGAVAFNKIDSVNGIGYIGYWLAKEFNGKGIMSLVVADLISIAREELGLQKVGIRCASQNRKSRAIPERLGFTREGTLCRVEKVNDQWLDHEMYALFLTDAES